MATLQQSASGKKTEISDILRFEHRNKQNKRILSFQKIRNQIY
jgi:hypothetical protein